jgi:phosphopantothenoylcysteine synthetase/decarboxylase
MVVAPATANTLSKWQMEFVITFLSLLIYRQMSCLFCACNGLDMYKHLQQLQVLMLYINWNTIIPAESGELASGLLVRENG